MQRREFLALTTAAVAAGLVARPALADVPTAFDQTLAPPMDDRQKFIDWMVKNRGEDPKYLGLRFDRFRHMVANKDLLDDRNKRAFLFTPREAFVLPQNLDRAYDSAFLDINFGVTISGPHLVGRMTTAIDVQPTDKVLEIGTGSGYQSAYLSHLTDKVWTIEIIKPLAARTRGFYDALMARGIPSSRPSPLRTPMAITAGRMPARSTRSSSPAASTTFRLICCSNCSPPASWSSRSARRGPSTC